MVKEFYVVLSFGPSLQSFPLLKIMNKWLLGRDYQALQWLLEIRGLKSSVSIENFEAIDVNNECLSLFDVQDTIANQQNLGELKALKELVR